MSAPARRRGWLAVVIGLVVSVIFLALLFRKVDPIEVWDEAVQASLGLLVLSQVTKGLGFLALTARSQLLLKPVGEYTFATVFRSVLVGFAGNNVLPARAGEVMRMAWLARAGTAPASACVAIVVVERMLDMAVLGVIAVLTLALLVLDVSGGVVLYAVTGLLIAGLAVAIAVARHPELAVAIVRTSTAPVGGRLADFAVRLAEGASKGLAALASPVAVAMAVAWTVAYWAAGVAGVALWLEAFALDVPWYAPLVVMVFVGAGAMLPSSPGAVGTWHYFAKSALTLLGVGGSAAASFALVGHFMAFVPWTLLSLPVLIPAVRWRARQG